MSFVKVELINIVTKIKLEVLIKLSFILDVKVFFIMISYVFFHSRGAKKLQMMITLTDLNFTKLS